MDNVQKHNNYIKKRMYKHLYELLKIKSKLSSLLYSHYYTSFESSAHVVNIPLLFNYVSIIIEMN
jgi:hypothetical protein